MLSLFTNPTECLHIFYPPLGHGSVDWVDLPAYIGEAILDMWRLDRVHGPDYEPVRLQLTE